MMPVGAGRANAICNKEIATNPVNGIMKILKMECFPKQHLLLTPNNPYSMIILPHRVSEYATTIL